jgi:hypothetical protein
MQVCLAIWIQFPQCLSIFLEWHHFFTLDGINPAFQKNVNAVLKPFKNVILEQVFCNVEDLFVRSQLLPILLK